MNKKQWQNIYKILNDARSEFLIAYPTYKNGKNKAIRKEAEYRVNNAISLADSHVKNNWEVYELLLEVQTSRIMDEQLSMRNLHDHIILMEISQNYYAKLRLK